MVISIPGNEQPQQPDCTVSTQPKWSGGKRLSGKCFHLSFCLSFPAKRENGYADGFKNISPGRKGWNDLHRIASGVPVHSDASRGKTAFHIHWCFLRKGRKRTREERKGAGDSLCICVQYGFFWFFILHSRGLPRGPHLLPGSAVPACLCESGSAAALDEANTSHLSPWHPLSSRAVRIKPHTEHKGRSA